MEDKKPADTELLEGLDLHPQSDSWIRITTRNNFVGFLIFLALAALFVLVINLRLSRGQLGILGVLAALPLVWLIWRSGPKRRSGLLLNGAMTARIKADIITELAANDVNVDSSKGVVTLRGNVPYSDFREAAEHLARQGGAHQVINELNVLAPGPEQPDSYLKNLVHVTTPEGAPEVATRLPLEERVREALEDDPRVNAYTLIARVENGLACLTGRQETVQASEAATEVAAHIPGILAVSNDIEILPSY